MTQPYRAVMRDAVGSPANFLQAAIQHRCRTTEKRRNHGFFGRIGWGTWIRTKINGVRVRRSTVELFPTRVSLARSVSGLIDKSFDIAKTQIGKKSSNVRAGSEWPWIPAFGAGRRCRRASAGAAEKPFGATGLRWYALPNETNDDTSGMRRSWRLARFSG